MPGFTLDNVSQQRLIGVHPDLRKVIIEAAETAPFRFRVTEGLRTPERQREMAAQGKSQTQDGLHLRQKDGFAHAVDLVAMPDDQVNWKWEWYQKLAAVIRAAALRLDVRIEWGGDWHTIKDGPHFQLARAYYK